MNHEYILLTLQKLLSMTQTERRAYLAHIEVAHGFDSTAYKFLSDSIDFIEKYTSTIYCT